MSQSFHVDAACLAISPDFKKGPRAYSAMWLRGPVRRLAMLVGETVLNREAFNKFALNQLVPHKRSKFKTTTLAVLTCLFKSSVR